MFIPKETKYKKYQKGKNFKRILKSDTIKTFNEGSIYLKAIESGRLNSRQIEAIRQSIQKIIKKFGRVVMHIYPTTPITKKPVEVRMGKGKGNIDHWVSKIRCGEILCEIETFNVNTGLKAMKAAQFRLPIKTKIFL